MEEFMKQLWTWLLALILAAFQPIAVAIVVLVLVWTLNIIMGISADKKNETDFSIKKAFPAVIQLLFVFAMLFVVSLATAGFGERSLAMTITKWITWVVAYFYITNIFRNGLTVWPNNKAISFIYSFLTTETFSYIKDYFKMKGGAE